MKTSSTLRRLAFSVIAALLVVMTLPAAVLAAPLPPTNLAAAVTAGPPLGVALTWTDASLNETGFRVRRAVAPSTAFTDLTAATNGLPANSVAFTDATVTAGVTYSYQVVAFDLTGDSPPSNTATVTASVPAASAGLTAALQAGPPQSVLLSWTDNSPDEIGFRIERATNAGFTVGLVLNARAANTAAGPVTFTDADIIPGVTYFYRVSALGAQGASAASNTATVTVTAAPGMVAGPPVPVPGFGPNSGFPLFYQDTLGTKLNLLPITAVNLADGVIAGNPYSQALGFGTEAFYYAAGAEGLDIGAGAGLVEFAIEAVFATAVPEGEAAPGQEAVMNRTRIRIDVPVSGNYTVTTPYHQGANALQFPGVVAGAPGFDINFTADIFSATPRDFASTTTGPVNVFLRPTTPPADPGLLGDGLTTGTVTGGPNGVNSVTITGPGGITATTNQWAINGRLLAAAVTPSFTRTINPATGLAPATVTFTDTSAGAPTTRAWDFGDGTTSAAANPTHVFNAAGNFIVRLTASNAGGSATASRMVSIFSVPAASFTSAVGATPLTINFTDTSTGNVTGWLWDFGDGTTTNLRNPSHAFAQAGTFNVTLRVFNPAGTAVTAAVPVVVGAVAPAAPTLNPGTVISATQVNLSWTDNSTNETAFRIERSVDNFATAPVVLGTTAANVTTFNDLTAPPGTAALSYRVIALNGALASPPSNVQTVATPAAAPGTPAGPTLISATAVSPTQVNLSWADNSTNETGFRIERSADNFATAPTVVTTTAANATTFNDTTAPANTTLSYRVIAVNGAVSSVASNTMTVATPPAAVAVPATPTLLTATTLGANQVSLSWTDNSANETGFRIDRATDPAFTANLVQNQVGAGVTTFNDTTIPAGATTLFYRVLALNAAGPSAPSNTAFAAFMAPAAPTLLTATAVAGAGITLTWTDNSNNETGFAIHRATDPNMGINLVDVGAVGANITTFTDTTAVPGTTYFYEVHATNQAGMSAPSASATATAMAAAPGPVIVGGGGGVVGGGAVVGGGGGGVVAAPPPPAASVTFSAAGSAPLSVVEGKVESGVAMKDEAGTITLTVNAGTRVTHKMGTPVASITSKKLASPPAPPPGTRIVVAYDFGPDGAQFSPALSLVISAPEGVKEGDRVAWWDGSGYVGLGGKVDLEKKTITVEVSHFTAFAVLREGAAPAAQPTVPPTVPPTPPPPAAKPTAVPPSPKPPVTTPAPKPEVTAPPATKPPAAPPVVTPAPKPTAPPVIAPPPAPAPEVPVIAPPPAETPAQPGPTTNWPLLIGILAAVIVAAIAFYYIWLRRPSEE